MLPDEVVISVAELGRRLKRAVESTTGREWVEGEVGSLRLAASGHAYFTLKDESEDAVVDCVAYRASALRAKRHLVDGARLQVFGRATVWAPRGRLQLVCDRVRPAGRGALLEALERLKQRLLAEGLFDPERKRPLPSSPRVVGVVTSAHGAAFEDIRTVAFRRGGARLVLAPAQVQGDGAAESIVRALSLLARYPELEVVIVGRGGGSGEDLMAFNDERVVRHIAGFPVPVVSAVGHEIDVTLADLAADVRAATPSQAAELVIADAQARLDALVRMRRQLRRALQSYVGSRRSELTRLRTRLSDPRFTIAERQQLLDEMALRLERIGHRAVARRRVGLEQLSRRISGRHPRTVLAQSHSRLDPLASRLASAMQLYLSRCRAEFSRCAVQLDGLSPVAILARGYAIVTTEDGSALRDATSVTPEQRLSLRLHRGRVTAVVVTAEGATSEPEESGPS